jgi:hypothetical protein
MSGEEAVAPPDGPYELTRIGIRFLRELDEKEYTLLGRKLVGLANVSAWAIGDWILAGKSYDEGGRRYELALTLTGRSFQTVSTYMEVAAAYTHDERDARVPWTWYREALRLPHADRVPAIRLAHANAWSRATLTSYVTGRLEGDGEAAGARAGQGVGHRGSRGSQHRPQPEIECPACGHRFLARWSTAGAAARGHRAEGERDAKAR